MYIYLTAHVTLKQGDNEPRTLKPLTDKDQNITNFIRVSDHKKYIKLVLFIILGSFLNFGYDT